jgi:hypothetical protein
MKKGVGLTRGSLIVLKASARDMTGGEAEKLDADVSISSEENL